MEQLVYHLLLLIGSVILIASGQRFPIEQQIYNKYKIDREWWLPLVTLCIGLSISLFDLSVVSTVFFEKIDIIVLIFTFGFLAEGLYQSDVFRFIAYKILVYADGNTMKLIVGIFVAVSGLTLLTTNDVVVILATPVLIELSNQIQLRNIKLLLLSQFIAANTISMALLTGSPTNIIIAEELSITFLEYMKIMAIPGVVSFLSSLCIVYICFRVFATSESQLISEYQLPSSYSVPESTFDSTFTFQMKFWSGLLFIFLLLVAVVTELDYSLLWCCAPVIILSLIYWKFSSTHTEPLQEPVSRLPYGVFSFALTFFIFSRSFSSLQSIQQTVPTGINSFVSSPLLSIPVSIFGSGFVVNVFNDLPAAALIADVLPVLSISTPAELVFLQGVLAGLNIGAYITQLGALAGILWFTQIRNTTEKYDMDFKIPSKYDLLLYGVLNFVITGIILVVVLYVELFLFSL